MVSIIVPLYNVEDYCKYCIKSLLSQTYTDLEIILVDDGSTDGTYEVCTTYAEQDKRIHVIQQKNAGVSVARNTGLINASGEFIMFADGDDIVSSKYVELLLSILEPEDAMATCAFARISDYKEPVFSEHIMTKDRKNCIECAELLLQARFPVSVWGAIFKADYLKGCKFPVGIRNNEDKYFIFRYLLNNPNASVVRTDAVLYDYYVRVNSATTTGFKGNLDTVTIADQMYKEIAVEYPNLQSLAWKNALGVRISTMHSVVMARKDYPEIYEQLKNDILMMSKGQILNKQAKLEVTLLKISDRLYNVLVDAYYNLMPQNERYRRNERLMKL